MSNTGGCLGKTKLVPNAVTEVARVPTNVNYVTMNICVSFPVDPAAAGTTEDGTLTLWITDNQTVADEDIYMPLETVKVNGSNEYACRICSPGEAIFARGSAGLVIRVEYAAEIAAE